MNEKLVRVSLYFLVLLIYVDNFWQFFSIGLNIRSANQTQNVNSVKNYFLIIYYIGKNVVASQTRVPQMIQDMSIL